MPGVWRRTKTLSVSSQLKPLTFLLTSMREMNGNSLTSRMIASLVSYGVSHPEEEAPLALMVPDAAMATLGEAAAVTAVVTAAVEVLLAGLGLTDPHLATMTGITRIGGEIEFRTESKDVSFTSQKNQVLAYLH